MEYKSKYDGLTRDQKKKAFLDNMNYYCDLCRSTLIKSSEWLNCKTKENYFRKRFMALFDLGDYKKQNIKSLYQLAFTSALSERKNLLHGSR